jgi:hypothetical protein
MKFFLAGLLVLGSFSAYSQDFSRGGVLKLEIDLQRAFDALSLKEFKSRKKARVDHCKYMYQNLIEASVLLEELIKSGEIPEKQSEFYLNIQDSQASIAESNCKALVGRKKALEIRDSFMKHQSLI